MSNRFVVSVNRPTVDSLDLNGRRGNKRRGQNVTALEARHPSIFGIPESSDGAKLRRQSESSARLQGEYHQLSQAEAHWLGPVLLFETGKDGFITREEAAQLRKYYPKAEIEHFADAGHLEVVTNPSRYIECIRRFLRTS